eukprot:scaffold2730_cov99-Isochrysis_galbana.AAC.4
MPSAGLPLPFALSPFLRGRSSHTLIQISSGVIPVLLAVAVHPLKTAAKRSPLGPHKKFASTTTRPALPAVGTDRATRRPSLRHPHRLDSQPRTALFSVFLYPPSRPRSPSAHLWRTHSQPLPIPALPQLCLPRSFAHRPLALFGRCPTTQARPLPHRPLVGLDRRPMSHDPAAR